MSHLLPCPGCNRHVRSSETSCPFCGQALDLANRPEPVLPRGRLGRAATFAFGATVVGATTLVGCSGETTESPGSGGATSGGSSGSAGSSTGGSGNSGGSANTGGSNGGGGGMVLDDGGVQPLYGAVPAAGSGNTTDGGMAGPVYGAPP